MADCQYKFILKKKYIVLADLKPVKTCISKPQINQKFQTKKITKDDILNFENWLIKDEKWVQFCISILE